MAVGDGAELLHPVGGGAVGGTAECRLEEHRGRREGDVGGIAPVGGDVQDVGGLPPSLVRAGQLDEQRVGPDVGRSNVCSLGRHAAECGRGYRHVRTQRLTHRRPHRRHPRLTS